MRILDWCRDWIRQASGERRKAIRIASPRLAAYYWNGDVPQAHPLKDVSVTGAFVCSDLPWYPGTVVDMLLQESPAGKPAEDSSRARSLHRKGKIVWLGADGFGVEFLHANRADRRALETFLSGMAGPIEARMKNHRDPARRGQSLVEFALILPLLFLLIINVVNFAAYLFAWITIANAARAASQYAVMGGAYVTGPTPPAGSSVQTVVANEVASLLNNPSVTVNVCTNNNGTNACSLGNAAAPSDPEPATYVSASIDISYAYNPPIPSWTFSRLGIHTTLPSSTIHRRVVMRMMQ